MAALAGRPAQLATLFRCSMCTNARNIKKRNGTDLDPFRGTEQQNKERFAMHAGTERKTTEGFMERNGTDRNGNGHISTPLASKKPMTSAIFMSRRDLQLLFFEKSKKSLQGCRSEPCRPPGPRCMDQTGTDLTERIGTSHKRFGPDRTIMGRIVIWNGTDRNTPDFPCTLRRRSRRLLTKKGMTSLRQKTHAREYLETSRKPSPERSSMGRANDLGRPLYLRI